MPPYVTCRVHQKCHATILRIDDSDTTWLSIESINFVARASTTDVMATVPKRSLFKKPTWATAPTQPSGATEERTFYRHSDTVYADIVAENERKRQERLARKSARETAQAKDDSYARDAKRRRLSDDEDGDDSQGYSSEDSQTREKTTEGSNKLIEVIPSPFQGTRSRGPAKSPDLHISPSKASTNSRIVTARRHQNVIDLADEDEEQDGTANGPKITRPLSSPKQTPQELSDESDSDDYMRELKQKAREKRRQELLGVRSEAATLKSFDTVTKSPSQSQQAPSLENRSSSTPRPDSQPSARHASSTESGPTCRILITSPIPNTSPLIVERLASQNLREVRQFWCKRQGFSEDFSRTVFLTWRHHRLYDISTCKNLADKASGSTTSTSFQNDIEDDFTSSFLERSNGQITVEAMTSALLDQAKKDALASQNSNQDRQTTSNNRLDPTLNSDSDNEDSYPHHQSTTASSSNNLAAAGISSQEKQKEPELRLLLRTSHKDIAPLKLKVRPSTPIWKLSAAFKDQRIRLGIENGTLVPGFSSSSQSSSSAAAAAAVEETSLSQMKLTLIFDGEVLDSEGTVGETEIEDTDTVDVVVKWA